MKAGDPAAFAALEAADKRVWHATMRNKEGASRGKRCKFGLTAFFARDGPSRCILKQDSATSFRLSLSRFVRPSLILAENNLTAAQITRLIKDHLIYFGFSMRDGTGGFFEMFLFAMDSQGPAFRKTTGEKIANPQDLLDMGFKTIVLHETSFPYNSRRLETMLHTHFWDERNRLWRARGAGSYYTSERHLKVRCCEAINPCEGMAIQTLFCATAS